MAFIIRTVIIAVDDSDRIVELQPVFESQSAPREQHQDPAFFHPCFHTGRNFHRFPGCKCYVNRKAEIISCRSGRRPLGKRRALIGGTDRLRWRFAERADPSFLKLFKAYLFEFSYPAHFHFHLHWHRPVPDLPDPLLRQPFRFRFRHPSGSP